MSPSPADLRRNYDRDVLLEADAAADPMAQFAAWFEAALSGEVYEPNAMALSTVGADGQPTARMVLLKGFDAGGFVFYTNLKAARHGACRESARFAAVLVGSAASPGADRWRRKLVDAGRGRRLLRQPAARQPHRRHRSCRRAG